MPTDIWKPIRRGNIYKMYINGKWVNSSNKKTLDVFNPANGKLVGKVQSGTLKDAEKAVVSASKSRDSIGKLEAVKRAEILRRAAKLLMKYKDEIRNVIIEESGKPFKLAEDEVVAASERLRYASEECKEIYGEEITGDLTPHKFKKIAIVVRQPLGTVLTITPFNYPLHIAVCKIAPAIAAGNSIVCKPSTQTPICLIMFTRLLELAGMPKGSFNLITGSGSEIGDYLVKHEDINMISFTGSTQVGKRLAELSGMKKLHLELGGKAPAIVLKDCNIDIAVKECLKGSLTFSGQRCDAISRILVEEDIADMFIKKILKEIKKWRIGDPKNPKTDIGPLINKNAIERVDSLIKDAIKKGAKLLLGGKYKGLFYEPTVLDYVKTNMRIAWEETFGPVITVMRVKSYEEAIKISNQSKYGLDACIFTQDIDKALDAGFRLEDGTVSINTSPSHALGLFPFGGDKDSGIGREGIKYSIIEMTKVHTIIFKRNY